MDYMCLLCFLPKAVLKWWLKDSPCQTIIAKKIGNCMGEHWRFPSLQSPSTFSGDRDVKVCRKQTSHIIQWTNLEARNLTQVPMVTPGFSACEPRTKEHLPEHWMPKQGSAWRVCVGKRECLCIFNTRRIKDSSVCVRDRESTIKKVT